MPIIRPKWIAPALITGRVPGRPRQTGQVRVLGGSPNPSAQPQNIFVRVDSWTWISSPMTASYSGTRRAPVEADRLLERVGGVEDPVLAECRARDLEADGPPLAEPVGDRDRRRPGQRHRHREVVVE